MKLAITISFLLCSCAWAGDLPKPGEVLTPAETLELCQREGWDLNIELIQKAAPIHKRFVSDGCSGGSPQTWRGVSLYRHCLKHDIAYYAGGSEFDKLRSDAELMLDVAQDTGDIPWAVGMFNAVQLGGHMGPWAWGKVGDD